MQDLVDNVPDGGASAITEERPFWSAPWDFAVHALVGTLIFSIIAGAAVLLDLGLRWLEAHGTSAEVVFGLKLAEYGLLLADLVLLAAFLWRTVQRTIKRL